MERVSPGTILCVNAGSSSLKAALYSFDDDGLGLLTRTNEPVAGGRYDSALEDVLAGFADRGLPTPTAVGHRVVHGGPLYTGPVLIDSDVLDELSELVRLAPLHLPASIAGIEALAARCPGVPQVACFDTAFHRRMPEVAQRLPLSEDLWRIGVRRYGFHGLSYEHVVASLGPVLGARAVVAHLGSGSSMAAIRDGVSVDTTMGLTPTGGLVMSTRAGDLDPGVAVYLLREGGYDAGGLEALLDRGSGLLAVSGSTGDMKTLLERRVSDPRAALAVEMFCTQARKHVGALAAVLGGIDTLVFTGGIGERSAVVRAEICDGLAHLGVRLDPDQNAADEAVISGDGGSDGDGAGCTVRVVVCDEELVIARHASELVGRVPGAGSG
ncbi:MAG: acetate kinase [Actinomycetota bacterium]|nr:acetate kinase [Actinomycetota bacterium]